MTPKLHWSEGKQDTDLLWVTLCGWLTAEVAPTPADVTCKKCKRALVDYQPDGATNYVDAVLTTRAPREFSPPPALIDPVSDLPFVSVFTWPVLKDQHHWCGHCPTCVWFTQMKALDAAAPWKKQHRLGTEHHRWSSVPAALEWYAHVRATGYAVATIGEVIAKLGKLGALIRSNNGGNRSIDEAEDAVVIEQALDRCYLVPSPRGLSRGERYYALFASAGGDKSHNIARDIRERNPLQTGLTGPMVSAVVIDGRLTVYEHLRQRDMVPPR